MRREEGEGEEKKEKREKKRRRRKERASERERFRTALRLSPLSSRPSSTLEEKKKKQERTFLASGSVLNSPGVLSPRAERYRSVSRKAAGTAPLASAKASCVSVFFSVSSF